MNASHSKLTDWGLGQASVGKADWILDVGCGGGRTVQKLAALATEGKVVGIDHSVASVTASRKANRRAIEVDRIEIRQASVSQLPFGDKTFDLATAVETHYFWPDLAADTREVLRVLKPGGRLVVIAEAYRGGKGDKRIRQLAELTEMKILSAAEHKEMLQSAGCSDVQVIEEYDKGWLCGIGRKTSAD
jgi:SAM-dependent methyltransferase